MRVAQRLAALLLGLLLTLPASLIGATPALAVGGEITIEGGGWGHGIGMSQYGAYGMALDGNGYRKILKHYYTGVSVTTLDGASLARAGGGAAAPAAAF